MDYYDLVAGMDYTDLTPTTKFEVFIETADYCPSCKQFIKEYNEGNYSYKLTPVKPTHDTIPYIYWYKDGRKYYYDRYYHPKEIEKYINGRS